MSTLRAIVAGAAGGLVGAALMGPLHAAAAKVTKPKPQQGEDATEQLAEAAAETITGRPLSESQRKKGGVLVHYVFGAAMGALYGLLAEKAPFVKTGRGTFFGGALYVGAHALAVPMLGLAPGPLDNGAAGEGGEFAAHLAYGAVAETVRRAIA